MDVNVERSSRRFLFLFIFVLVVIGWSYYKYQDSTTSLFLYCLSQTSYLSSSSSSPSSSSGPSSPSSFQEVFDLDLVVFFQNPQTEVELFTQWLSQLFQLEEFSSLKNRRVIFYSRPISSSSSSSSSSTSSSSPPPPPFSPPFPTQHPPPLFISIELPQNSQIHPFFFHILQNYNGEPSSSSSNLSYTRSLARFTMFIKSSNLNVITSSDILNWILHQFNESETDFLPLSPITSFDCFNPSLPIRTRELHALVLGELCQDWTSPQLPQFIVSSDRIKGLHSFDSLKRQEYILFGKGATQMGVAPSSEEVGMSLDTFWGPFFDCGKLQRTADFTCSNRKSSPSCQCTF